MRSSLGTLPPFTSTNTSLGALSLSLCLPATASSSAEWLFRDDKHVTQTRHGLRREGTTKGGKRGGHASNFNGSLVNLAEELTFGSAGRP